MAINFSYEKSPYFSYRLKWGSIELFYMSIFNMSTKRDFRCAEIVSPTELNRPDVLKNEQLQMQRDFEKNTYNNYTYLLYK